MSERLGIREETLRERYPMLRAKPNSFYLQREKDTEALLENYQMSLPKGSPEERDIAVLALQGAHSILTTFSKFAWKCLQCLNIDGRLN